MLVVLSVGKYEKLCNYWFEFVVIGGKGGMVCGLIIVKWNEINIILDDF